MARKRKRGRSATFSDSSEDGDGRSIMTTADVEAGMVLALRAGEAELGWAKAPQDPWWPCIAARSSMEPLGLFDDIDPGHLCLPLEPDGALPRGQVVAYFLGEETCCLVDNGLFDAGVYAKRPNPRKKEESAEYAAGVEQAARLQGRLDSLEEGAEMGRLRAAVQAGKATVVEADVMDMDDGVSDGAGSAAPPPPQLLRASWPAVSFGHDWEAAKATDLGLAIPERALQAGEALVLRLGGAWGSPQDRWGIASVNDAGGSNGNNKKEGARLAPLKARFVAALHAAAVEEARALSEGGGVVLGEEGGGAAGAMRRARTTRSGAAAAVSTDASAAIAAAAAAAATAADVAGAGGEGDPKRRPLRTRPAETAGAAAAVPPSPAVSVASTTTSTHRAAATTRRPPSASAASAPAASAAASTPAAPTPAAKTHSKQQQQRSNCATGPAPRPLTPEEVEKIRRLAEGLLFMGEVARHEQQQQQQGGSSTLREDLNALRVFVSRGFPALNDETLVRLEVGLRGYVGRMRAQLACAQREFDRFASEVQEDKGGVLSACGGACGELHKEVKRTLGKLEAHRAALEEGVLGRVKRAKSGGGALMRMVTAEAEGALAGVRASIAALRQLQEAVVGGGGGGGGGGSGFAGAAGALLSVVGGAKSEGGGDGASVSSASASISASASGHHGKQRAGSSRLDVRELVFKGEAAFKLGQEVTKDQIAAAEHLLRACEDFRQRLARKREKGAEGSSTGRAVDRAQQRAAAERRQSADAQAQFFHNWSPVY